MMHAVRCRRSMIGLRTTLLALVVAGAWVVPAGQASVAGPPASDQTQVAEEADQPAPDVDLAYLNIRLSTRAVEPPAAAIRSVVPLTDIRVARPRIGPPPRAAILEDDQRRRAIILRVGDREDLPVEALVLTDLDLESHLPALTRCTQLRGCATDRRPGVGGLSCVAMCLVETLR